MSGDEIDIGSIEDSLLNDAGVSTFNISRDNTQHEAAVEVSHEVNETLVEEVKCEDNAGECETEDETKITKPTFKFMSDPPPIKEALSTTTILAGGKFSKRQKHCSTYINSNRKAAPIDDVYEGGEEDEEEEEYTGRHFTGRGYSDRIPLNTRRYPQRRYEPRNYSSEWDRPRDRIEYSSFFEEDDKETLRKAKDVEEIVPKGLQNKYGDAIPEDLIWKNLGKHMEYLPMNTICPYSDRFDHIKFERSVLESEKYRMNLIYNMICEGGIMHIEDLWKVYLNRNKIEDYPFDGFTHFARFISVRSHVFGMDQKLMVYNQNLVVTVAVMRYVHTLYHDFTVISAPRVHKPQAKKLFYRAFLSFMTKDDLSFDTFFRNFPSLFQYDENSSTWKLNHSSACSIPCAFIPDCLPKRNHTTKYVDRSIIFNGVGEVFANNIVNIKILSEDSLRSHIKYVVSVPINVCDDREKYPIGSRVAFSGVRMYNGQRETVQGTRIELAPKENDRNYDGTIDVFTINEDEEEEKIEYIKETRECEVRILQVREELALREEDKKMAIRRIMKKERMEIMQLFNQVDKEFCNNLEDFLRFIHNRPFYYQIHTEEGNEFVSKRPTKVRRKMIELMVELDMGKDGRPYYKDEAIEKCSSYNSSVEETMKFNLGDLSTVLDYRKMLFTSPDGLLSVFTFVSPLFHWDHKHNILLQL